MEVASGDPGPTPEGTSPVDHGVSSWDSMICPTARPCHGLYLVSTRPGIMSSPHQDQSSCLYTPSRESLDTHTPWGGPMPLPSPPGELCPPPDAPLPLSLQTRSSRAHTASWPVPPDSRPRRGLLPALLKATQFFGAKCFRYAVKESRKPMECGSTLL